MVACIAAESSPPSDEADGVKIMLSNALQMVCDLHEWSYRLVYLMVTEDSDIDEPLSLNRLSLRKPCYA